MRLIIRFAHRKQVIQRKSVSKTTVIVQEEVIQSCYINIQLNQRKQKKLNASRIRKLSQKKGYGRKSMKPYREQL